MSSSALFRSIKYCLQNFFFGKPIVIKYVNEFVFDQTETNYNLCVESLNATLNLCTEFSKQLNQKEARILAVLPDGKAFFDSSKGSKNTYANFKSDLIHPNGVTRASIRSAMDSTSGVGAEIKFSDTTKKNESYVAIRGGNTSDDIVYVIRLSFVL